MSTLVCCQALYDYTDEVYDLTPDNFEKMVLDSHFVWIVEFYAPWYVPACMLLLVPMYAVPL